MNTKKMFCDYFDMNLFNIKRVQYKPYENRTFPKLSTIFHKQLQRSHGPNTLCIRVNTIIIIIM